MTSKKSLVAHCTQLIALFAFALISFTTNAQDADSQIFDGANCTSIMVGKDATTDGSVITSHTCDGMYRTWLRWEKAEEHKKGDTQKIYRGSMHTRNAYDNYILELAGEIPQATYTYAYLNTAYPCLNEKQLAIGNNIFRSRHIGQPKWFIYD